MCESTSACIYMCACASDLKASHADGITQHLYRDGERDAVVEIYMHIGNVTESVMVTFSPRA
jgi:hypothetical protein